MTRRSIIAAAALCAAASSAACSSGGGGSALPAGPHCPPGAVGPDCLFNLPAVEDPGSLGLSLDGPVTLGSAAGVTVAAVPFRFQGAAWHGLVWSHHGTLFLPAPATPRTVAAIYSEYTQPGSDVPDPLTLDSYGRQAAAASGVPVAVVADIPPPSVTISGSTPETTPLKTNPALSACFDTPLAENTFLFCADAIAAYGGDYSWNGASALSASYLRALLALTQLDPVMRGDPAAAGFGSFAPTAFATGGYSKRGMAQWYLPAVESRIARIWVGSAEYPSLLSLESNIIAQWGDPSGTVGTTLSFLQTPAGAALRGVSDPAQWASRLGSTPIAMMRGTNDEVWPFDEIDAFRASFPGIGATGWVGDAMHISRADGSITIFAPEALAEWHEYLRGLAGARPRRSVAASLASGPPMVVTATVSSGSGAAVARAWWTSGIHCSPPSADNAAFGPFPGFGTDQKDMRDLAWSSAAMSAITGTAGRFTYTLPARSQMPLHAQLYVDLTDGTAQGDYWLSSEPLLLSTAGGVSPACH